jgi:hypothetical protein
MTQCGWFPGETSGPLAFLINITSHVYIVNYTFSLSKNFPFEMARIFNPFARKKLRFRGCFAEKAKALLVRRSGGASTRHDITTTWVTLSDQEFAAW